jgi:hypothetical protein
MDQRLDDPSTGADPLLRGVFMATLAIAAVGMLLLVRASFGGGVDHVTVRVDNQGRSRFRSTRSMPRASWSG